MLVALLCALPAAAEDPRPRIRVSGEGSVAIAPDMALVTLTVNREATTAREALSANSGAMASVMDAMRSLGIANRDLQTAGFSIQPVYRRASRTAQGGGERELSGYSVRNTLTVRVRDIDRVGEVLDTSVTLGVNEGGSLRFTNDDPSEALAGAREKAVRDATARARGLAAAAGVELGELLAIDERGGPSAPVPMARASMAMGAESAVPIATGENTYRVSVEMTFAIGR